MATVNGSLRTKRPAAVKPTRAVRHSSDRTRKQAKLAQLRGSRSGYYEQGRDKVHQLERTLEHFIRTQSLNSVLIGACVLTVAGVGLLLGRYWMRR